jgi:ABC-type multidrug transport system ATPase subunit
MLSQDGSGEAISIKEGETAMRLMIDSVSKQYGGKVWGLREFSLNLGPGVLGLVGPNGAGKSTLMRILATVTRATEGKVTWTGNGHTVDIGKQPDELRQVLGYLPQDFGIYPHLNAIEFLEYLAAIKGLDGRTARHRIDELLQVVNLVDAARRPLGGYSGGMKQRVGIAQALLNDPLLLIVDEPTAGLDPEERVRFRSLVAELSGERIVILSTHIVSDVEATATSIAVIVQGRLVRHALPEELLQAVEGKVWMWLTTSQELTALKQQYLISSTARRSDGVHVRVVAEQKPNGDAEPVSASLEDAYLYFVRSSR